MKLLKSIDSRWIGNLHKKALSGGSCLWDHLCFCFLVAKSDFPSIGPSVGPSVVRSVRDAFFLNRGIQAEKWSNFHQYPCPTYPTDAVVYLNLLLSSILLSSSAVEDNIGIFRILNDLQPFCQLCTRWNRSVIFWMDYKTTEFWKKFEFLLFTWGYSGSVM